MLVSSLWLFIAGMVVTAWSTYTGLTYVVERGWWQLTIPIMLVASPGIMFTLWVLVQHGQPGFSTFTFGNISYAAVIGDGLIFPAALTVAVIGWKLHHDEIDARWRRSRWFWRAFIIALICAAIFQFVIGGEANSASSIPRIRLHNAPLSWGHNFGVFPAILGILIYAIWPLLRTAEARRIGLWALGVAVLFFVFVGLDLWRTTLPVTSYWHCNLNWLNVDHYHWVMWRLFG